MADLDTPTGRTRSTALFNHSYIVLSILLLITAGVTIAYYQNSAAFADETGTRWTPVVFLIGLCVSLVLFGMTHREATARARLMRRTNDLLAAQKENRTLLEAEQKSRIAAENANRAKDEFLAVVSHELKTPLNAIAGWSRILRTDGISEQARESALDKIDKNLRMQTAIVEELLNFSDVMSTPPAMLMRPIPISDVIGEAVQAVSVSAFQKGITLDSEMDLDGTHIDGDRGRLKMAIVNVISNAVKFTPQGGNVKVSGSVSDGDVQCVVVDNGLGISSDFLPHIFEQYKQSEAGTTRHFGGLGLGLAIARHIIVEQHHGDIAAESSGLGSGAKFTISLPMKQP